MQVKILIGLTIIIVIFILALLHKFITTRKIKEELRKNGIKTEGEVIQCIYNHEMENDGTGVNTDLSAVIVTYKDDLEQQQEAHLSHFSSELVKGQKIDIIYLKNNLERVYPASII